MGVFSSLVSTGPNIPSVLLKTTPESPWEERTSSQMIQLGDKEFLVVRPSGVVAGCTEDTWYPLAFESGAVGEKGDFMFSPPLRLRSI